MEMSPKRSEVVPTEVTPKATRRTFSNTFKRTVLAEADAAGDEAGQIAALLRRYGLYSSHLSEWRRARDAGELGGPVARRRGPRPVLDATAQTRIQQLEQQLTQMTRRAERAEMVVELQKKVADLLSSASTPTGETR
jgi:transposase-like protein